MMNTSPFALVCEDELAILKLMTTQIPIDSFVIDLAKGIDRNEEIDDDDI